MLTSAPSSHQVHLHEVGREIRQSWVTILTAAIGMGCGLAAIPIYTLGAFTKPLAETFGWSRADVQGIFSWITIGNLVAAPLLGMLIDRYGIRRITLFSVFATGMGFMAFGLLAGPLWSFYAIAFVTALLGVGTVPITWTRAIVGSFDRGRGLALGLALAGTGIAAFCLPLYVTWLIGAFSWRVAYIGLGALPLVLAFPFAYFFLHDDQEEFTARQAIGSSALFGIGEALGTLASATRNYRFWVIFLTFFIGAACTGGIIAHFIPIMTDGGISAVAAAKIAGVIGIAIVIGRIGTGYLIDQYWAPGVSAIALCLPIVSCLSLAFDPGNPSFGLLAAACIGLTAGAEFDLMSYLVSQYFDRGRYGSIYGTLYAVCKFAGGMAAPLFGMVFDKTGTYRLVLFGVLVSFAVAGGLLLTLGPYMKTNHSK